MYTVFDASVFQNMYNHNLTFDRTTKAKFQYAIKPPEGNRALSNASEKSINALIGSVHFLYGRVLKMNDIILKQNEKAIGLITLLKKEYNLEDE